MRTSSSERKGHKNNEIENTFATQKLRWNLPEDLNFRRLRPSQLEQLDESNGTKKGKGAR
jgi:hypothetical protein